MTCDQRQVEIPYGVVSCSSCGYPQNGSPEEKTYWLNNTQPKDATYVALKRFEAARSATYAYGILGTVGTILVGLFANWQENVLYDSISMAVLGIGLSFSALFIILARISRNQPKQVFIITAVIMALFGVAGTILAFQPIRLIIEIALFVPVVRAIRVMDDLPQVRKRDQDVLDAVAHSEV